MLSNEILMVARTSGTEVPLARIVLVSKVAFRLPYIDRRDFRDVTDTGLPCPRLPQENTIVIAGINSCKDNPSFIYWRLPTEDEREEVKNLIDSGQDNSELPTLVTKMAWTRSCACRDRPGAS